MKRNILITIEYDGSNFSGWQRQPDKRTVQKTLEDVLSRVCSTDIKIDGTSRTDAGVHALGQRASFFVESGIPTDKIMLAANNMLMGGKNTLAMGDVQIVGIKEVPLDFHARFNAKGKTYRYKILNSNMTDIFQRNFTYQIREPLDIEKMREAARLIEGTHDFKCFQTSGGNERLTTVRTIWKISISREGDYVCIDVSGDGFLYNMVRIIVGTLVEVGLGKRSIDSVGKTIESMDRQRAGHTAPAEGLYLMEVYY